MRALGLAGRLFSRLLVTTAKAIGAMSGAPTFTTENATAAYIRPDDYRP